MSRHLVPERAPEGRHSPLNWTIGAEGNGLGTETGRALQDRSLAAGALAPLDRPAAMEQLQGVSRPSLLGPFTDFLKDLNTI